MVSLAARNLSFLFSDRIDKTTWIGSRFIELNYLTSAASCAPNILSPPFLHESLNINRFVFLSSPSVFSLLPRPLSLPNWILIAPFKRFNFILNLEFLIMRWAKSVNGTRRGKGESSALVKVFQVQKTSNRQPRRSHGSAVETTCRTERRTEQGEVKRSE